MAFLWTVEKRLKSKLNQKFSTPVFRADGRVFFWKKIAKAGSASFFHKKNLAYILKSELQLSLCTLKGNISQWFKGLSKVTYLCKLDSFLFLLHTDPFNYWMYENSINNILKIISEITLKFLTLNQWAQKVTTGGFHWQLFATLLVNGEITFVE